MDAPRRTSFTRIAFDAAGRVLLGAGNKGNVYRIESPTRYTALLTMPATQITAFQTGQNGRLYAATGNVGKVYEIGPGLEKQGTIESDVFDASMYTLWGRLSFEAQLNGGTIAIETRSGNLDQPQKNWSPWSSPITSQKGGRVASPPARFVQWRATLTADTGGPLAGAGIGGCRVPAEERGAAPGRGGDHAGQLQIPCPELRSADRALAAVAEPAAAGPARDAVASASRRTAARRTPAMQLAKGFIGARWLASDPNGDPMIYTVEIRGVNETRVEAAEGQGRGEISGLGLDGVSGRRVPAAGHCVGRAGESAGRGADVANGERAVPRSTTRRRRSRGWLRRETAASCRSGGTRRMR